MQHVTDKWCIGQRQREAYQFGIFIRQIELILDSLEKMLCSGGDSFKKVCGYGYYSSEKMCSTPIYSLEKV